MTGTLVDFVDAVRNHYDDGCFACGRANPIGLHLDEFDLSDGEVSAVFTPGEHFRGAGVSLHGGVAATAMDEILVWAGILTFQVITVTGTMELRYRRPVLVDETVVATARVDDRSGSRIRASGELTVAGQTRVTGSGLSLVSGELGDLGTDWAPVPATVEGRDR